MKYIIGTRGSKLALVQTNYVCRCLQEAYPEDSFEINVITTKGDLIQDRPLDQIGDKGLFVTEIEEQILSGEIHIGVHSMKDMPAEPEKGLTFTKSWKREDPRDVLVLREHKSLLELPQNAVIATGSKRRGYQLLAIRPDLKVVDIRGNVDTRLRKMEEQKLDGIVLAAAGLKRLGMESVITQYMDCKEMISAPAQGILALEIKEGNDVLKEKLDALSDEETMEIAVAERGFLSAMGGDCHMPVGAVCNRLKDGQYELCAMFGNEDGSRLAYTKVCGTDTKALAKEAAKDIRRQLSGKVYLVGGGPGDPGLITAKGLDCIRQADCIVYDRLSSPELLEEAGPDCEMIYVGKANHNHTMPQEEINLLLVKKAMEHSKVVRLKGGDVYVFGRGGEEGLTLEENGISFEVIPGISSALAGLAYAGIPITHRGIATGFHVVTAHNRRDELADINFEAMAYGRDTCVFLMGLSKAGEIADQLMKAGMAPDTKAAVISHATTFEQKTCVATLATLKSSIEAAGLTSPALIVVGNVINLREQLNFFENKPLFGRRYLVTKIGNKVSRLTKLLKEQGAMVEEVTTGYIKNIQVNFTREQLSEADWLLFSSRNSVESFFINLMDSGLDVRALGGSKVAAIGSATAEALRKHGIEPDLIPEEYNSSAFGEELSKIVKLQEQVWYLRVANVEDQLKEKLEGSCQFREISVYENVPADSLGTNRKADKELVDYDGILFTCGSSAKRLLTNRSEALYEQLNAKGTCICIGPVCSRSLHNIGITTSKQSKQATYESMVELLTSL